MSAAERPIRRGRGLDIVFALALALFTGVSVWFARAIHDFVLPSTPNIFAPTLLGQTEADAEKTAQVSKVKVVVVARTSSDRYLQDTVMSQDPKPGTQVREGRAISIVVSTGVQIFPMPDLRYESSREVQLDLSHFKLQLGKSKSVPNDDVPAGQVVSQDPLPLRSVRVGQLVNLELSQGPPSSVRVPNFVQTQIEDARDTARRDGIRLGQIVWTPFGKYGPPRGIVVRQRPGPGAQVDPFSSVSLQVSAGPQEFGYLIREVHSTVSVPASVQESAKVRVVVNDDTGEHTAFDGYARARQKLDFGFNLVGTAALQVFVNDDLVSSAKLGEETDERETKNEVQPPPRPADAPDPFATPCRPGTKRIGHGKSAKLHATVCPSPAPEARP